MTDQYPVPAQAIEIEEEIKHSRFISLLFHCPSEQVFKSELAKIKLNYPGASHYCYAFVLAEPWNDVATGCSDDGEPSGSAGLPILACLVGSGIGEIAAVVIRYYGGTKLGVGGLVRAYSSGVKQGVSQLETQVKQIRFSGRLICEYHQLKDVEHAIKLADGIVLETSFTDKVRIEFAIPKRLQSKLTELLATMSQGQLVAEFPL